MSDENFDKDEAIFLSLMYSFHAAGMQHLGKTVSPLTGKVERDLDAARGTVGVLEMFQRKTAGNLTDRERRTLTNLITELQLNYVDECGREPAAPEEAAAGEPEAKDKEG
jgi:hypothetical protein